VFKMVRYLAIGPHPDDVESGCMASLINQLTEKDELMYIVISRCLDIPRNKNIMFEWNKVIEYLKSILPCKFESKIFNFANRRMAEQHMEIRSMLDEIREKFAPHIVFTTSPKDLHQDHEYIGRETIRVFRECTVISYEIPRSVGVFIPNMYQVLNENDVLNAIKILNLYQSQSKKKYMKKELIWGTYKHRGGEIGREYAQAFEILRLVVDKNKKHISEMIN